MVATALMVTPGVDNAAIIDDYVDAIVALLAAVAAAADAVAVAVAADGKDDVVTVGTPPAVVVPHRTITY